MSKEVFILRIDTVEKSGHSHFQVLGEGPKEEIFARFEEVSLKHFYSQLPDRDRVDYAKKSIVRSDNSEVKSERYPEG